MIFPALFGIISIAVVFGLLASQKTKAFSDTPVRARARPIYHIMFVALCTLVTGLIALGVIGIASAYLVDARVNASLNEFVAEADTELTELDDGVLSQIERDLILRDAQAFSKGQVTSDMDTVRKSLGEQIGSLTTMRLYSGVGLVMLITAIAGLLAYRRIGHGFRAQAHTEAFVKAGLGFAAVIAIFTTLGIVLSLIGETIHFFSYIPIGDFLFGTTWSPLSGVFDGKLEPDKVGALPLFAGTLLITLIAMAVAIPCGVFAAIYLSDFASSRTRAIVKPILEILAGIPTVVYGFFAAITIAPIIRDFGEAVGLNVDAQSALAAGSVMGIMIIPFISSLSDDVINAVPQNLRDGALALGATKGETISKVVLPAALPGIVSAIILGVSRAAGETMIVVMAAGQSANMTWNPFESVTTVTVQIVALITGDTEAETAAGPAFALGFVLFCLTLIFNVIALLIVRKYRERYE